MSLEARCEVNFGKRGVSAHTCEEIVRAARDTSLVSGYTHKFYRYPARSSPVFARRIIQVFTEQGDLVLDPFMGGGTTLVEALSLNREAVGVDVSSLAAFVAKVKTTPLADAELAKVARWAAGLRRTVGVKLPSTSFDGWAENGYYRHLQSSSTWRLRKSIEQALEATAEIRPPKVEAFARCVILRTAQWALDGRKSLPSIAEFRNHLEEVTVEMIAGARELRHAISQFESAKGVSVRCLNESVIGLERLWRKFRLRAPKLILTSPPYPGIHVLYHRWQVDGRKETPAPFWIADQLDGAGPSYYTMGDRKAVDQKTYFDQLRAALYSIRCISTEKTIVVQVVAFSNPALQLPRYLNVCEDIGLSEMRLPLLAHEGDGRLWRTVPNRKWHADQLGKTSASREVVLFHRPRLQ